MDADTVAERLNRYVTALPNHFDVEMVILYGSYSNGTARTDSDIDVAVVVDSIGDDLLDSEAALYRLRKTIDE